MIKTIALKSVVAGLTVAAVGTFSASAQAAPKVIELVQVPCQFLEVEPDHGYVSTMKSDCEVINEKNGEKRVSEAKTITLKPGDYVFRVTNKNVPYELGFWLREKDYNWANPLHKLSKISVSGGGMQTGKTLDYAVTLKPGEYLYSCPLNTTPDYKLVVTEN